LDKELDWVELTDYFVNGDNLNKWSLEKIDKMLVDTFATIAYGINAKKKCYDQLMDTSGNKPIFTTQSA